MNILSIKIYPAKILRQKAKKVVDIKDEKIQQLISDMKETMLKKDGVGLAAPQVGESERIIVVNTKDGVIALINPKVLRFSIKKELDEEGCLSFPGIFGLVKRCLKIKVIAYDYTGKKVTFIAKGLLARVILHEIDHLNGILFIDKMEKITQGEKKLEQYEKSTGK